MKCCSQWYRAVYEGKISSPLLFPSNVCRFHCSIRLTEWRWSGSGSFKQITIWKWTQQHNSTQTGLFLQVWIPLSASVILAYTWLIVQVCAVLRRVLGSCDWRFDSLCWSHLQRRQTTNQQCILGLHQLRRSTNCKHWLIWVKTNQQCFSGLH